METIKENPRNRWAVVYIIGEGLVDAEGKEK